MKRIILYILMVISFKANAQNFECDQKLIIKECFLIIDLFESRNIKELDNILNNKYHLDYSASELNEISGKYDETQKKHGFIDKQNTDVNRSFSQENNKKIVESASVIFHFGSNQNSKLIFDYEMIDSNFCLKSLTLFSIPKEKLDKIFDGL